MRMRLTLAVVVVLAAVGGGPLLAQPDLEDEDAPGLGEPDLDEPDVEPDEPEATPEAPQDHGSHDGEGHQFEGGAGDDLPTEPAADVDPGAETAPGLGGVPVVPAPSVPSPPSPGPARPAGPAAAAPAAEL